MNRLLIFGFCILVTLSSCSKSSLPKPSNIDTTKTASIHGFDVYGMGQEGISIRYSWSLSESGLFNSLAITNTSSYANSIAINCADVHTAGYYIV